MSRLLPIYKKVGFQHFTGFIDPSGKIVVEPQYIRTTDSDDGWIVANLTTDEQKERVFILNPKGEISSELFGIDAAWSFSEGISHGYKSEGDCNCVLFNKEGEIIHEFERGVGVFESSRENKILLCRSNQIDGGYHLAFFDTQKLKMATDFSYEDFVSSFYEGLAVVYDIDATITSYFVNHQFDVFETIPCLLNEKKSKFNQGIAPVREKKRKKRYESVDFFINKKGKKAFDLDFKEAFPCNGGFASVIFLDRDYGIINSLGEIIYKTSRYHLGNYFYNKIGSCYDPSSKKYGIIDVQGNILSPLDFDFINVGSNFIIGNKNNKAYYIQTNGEIIHPLYI